jgi:hypothetical protein
MLGAMLQLGLATLLMALLIVGAIAYATLAARRRGWWRAPLAVAFAVGWLVFLFPFALAFFYASPWDLTLRGSDTSVYLSLCESVGATFVFGSLLVEIALLVSRTKLRKSRVEPSDRFLFVGFAVVSNSLGLGAHLSPDFPDFAAYEAWTWWVALLAMLTGMTVLVMAQRAQKQRAVPSNAVDGAS